MEKIEITITMEKQEKPPLLGFHQNWLSADEIEANLSCGAGLGNPWLQAKIGDTYYVGDIREFFTALVDAHTNGS